MSDDTWAGECPECGIVWGDDVDVEFPCGGECLVCGSDLEQMTIAPLEQIEEAAA